MPYTPKPTSFQDFVNDANGQAPILVYRASECPSVPDALGRGSDCYLGHHSSKYYTCDLGEDCLNSFEPCDFDSEKPDYILVVPPSFIGSLPTHWICELTQNYPYKELDWILALPHTVKRILQEEEPFAAIWEYKKGPRRFSQHGGDEDWTVVVRKSEYVVKYDEYNDDAHGELCLDALDSSSVIYEDEEDFRVFTGAHA